MTPPRDPSLVGKAIRLALAAALLGGCLVAGLPQAPQAIAQEESIDTAEPTDPLAIPEEADADELLQFMQGLLSLRPEGESPQERAASRTRAMWTMIEATQRLEKAQPNDRQLATAWNYRLMTLQFLDRLGEEQAKEKFDQAIAVARAHQNPRIAHIGLQAYISARAQRWNELAPTDKQAFLKELLASPEQGDGQRDGPTVQTVSTVHMAASMLERRDAEFTKQLLAQGLELFQTSDNIDVREAAAQLAGLSRRLNLPGSVLELEGSYLDGQPLDWASYRGKVVLVDFWATWCGPCRAEVPNIIEMYEGYHDKGFEVLGISLDEESDDSVRYVAEMEIPWRTLFPEEGEPTGWANPIARHYGIDAIPTAILLDREGKVVHMNARGRFLQQQLQLLLGDPVEIPEEVPEDEAEAGE